MRATTILAGALLSGLIASAGGALANEPGGGDAGGGGSGGGDAFHYGTTLERAASVCRSLADRLNEGVDQFLSAREGFINNALRQESNRGVDLEDVDQRYVLRRAEAEDEDKDFTYALLSAYAGLACQ